MTIHELDPYSLGDTLRVVISGHVTKMAVTPFAQPWSKSLAHAELMDLSFIEPELWVIEVYIAGIGILDVFGYCDLDLDPMTFIYELDPYSIASRYTGCKNINILRQGFQKLSSDRQTCRQTDRQTESTEIINHAASRVVNKY